MKTTEQLTTVEENKRAVMMQHTPGLFPPGTGFIIAYTLSPEFVESEREREIRFTHVSFVSINFE